MMICFECFNRSITAKSKESPTSLEIRAGIQEDWSQTILNLNKQKFVATEEIRLQYHMKLELNFLKDWQPFGLFSK